MPSALAPWRLDSCRAFDARRQLPKTLDHNSLNRHPKIYTQVAWLRPIRHRWCGSDRPPSSARSHLPEAVFVSAPSMSNQWPSFTALEWWSTLSSRCASTCHEQQTCFYVACDPSYGRWSRRHGTAGISLRLVEIGLLQCRPCRPSGFNVGAVLNSAACCSSFGPESPATWSGVGGFEGAALVPSRTTNRLQAVLVSPQVITWSSARVHQQHVEAGC